MPPVIYESRMNRGLMGLQPGFESLFSGAGAFIGNRLNPELRAWMAKNKERYWDASIGDWVKGTPIWLKNLYKAFPVDEEMTLAEGGGHLYTAIDPKTGRSRGNIIFGPEGASRESVVGGLRSARQEGFGGQAGFTPIQRAMDTGPLINLEGWGPAAGVQAQETGTPEQIADFPSIQDLIVSGPSGVPVPTPPQVLGGVGQGGMPFGGAVPPVPLGYNPVDPMGYWRQAIMQMMMMQPQQFKQGGPVRKKNDQLADLLDMIGVERGRGGVPIIAHEGEFVVNREAADMVGRERLEEMNRLARTPRYQGGGSVGNYTLMYIVELGQVRRVPNYLVEHLEKSGAATPAPPMNPMAAQHLPVYGESGESPVTLPQPPPAMTRMGDAAFGGATYPAPEREVGETGVLGEPVRRFPPGAGKWMTTHDGDAFSIDSLFYFVPNESVEDWLVKGAKPLGMGTLPPTGAKSWDLTATGHSFTGPDDPKLRDYIARIGPWLFDPEDRKPLPEHLQHIDWTDPMAAIEATAAMKHAEAQEDWRSFRIPTAAEYPADAYSAVPDSLHRMIEGVDPAIIEGMYYNEMLNRGETPPAAIPPEPIFTPSMGTTRPPVGPPPHPPQAEVSGVRPEPERPEVGFVAPRPPVGPEPPSPEPIPPAPPAEHIPLNMGGDIQRPRPGVPDPRFSANYQGLPLDMSWLTQATPEEAQKYLYGVASMREAPARPFITYDMMQAQPDTPYNIRLFNNLMGMYEAGQMTGPNVEQALANAGLTRAEARKATVAADVLEETKDTMIERAVAETKLTMAQAESAEWQTQFQRKTEDQQLKILDLEIRKLEVDAEYAELFKKANLANLDANTRLMLAQALAHENDGSMAKQYLIDLTPKDAAGMIKQGHDIYQSYGQMFAKRAADVAHALSTQRGLEPATRRLLQRQLVESQLMSQWLMSPETLAAETMDHYMRTIVNTRSSREYADAIARGAPISDDLKARAFRDFEDKLKISADQFERLKATATQIVQHREHLDQTMRAMGLLGTGGTGTEQMDWQMLLRLLEGED